MGQPWAVARQLDHRRVYLPVLGRDIYRAEIVHCDNEHWRTIDHVPVCVKRGGVASFNRCRACSDKHTIITEAVDRPHRYPYYCPRDFRRDMENDQCRYCSDRMRCKVFHEDIERGLKFKIRDGRIQLKQQHQQQGTQMAKKLSKEEKEKLHAQMTLDLLVAAEASEKKLKKFSEVFGLELPEEEEGDENEEEESEDGDEEEEEEESDDEDEDGDSDEEEEESDDEDDGDEDDDEDEEDEDGGSEGITVDAEDLQSMSKDDLAELGTKINKQHGKGTIDTKTKSPRALRKQITAFLTKNAQVQLDDEDEDKSSKGKGKKKSKGSDDADTSWIAADVECEALDDEDDEWKSAKIVKVSAKKGTVMIDWGEYEEKNVPFDRLRQKKAKAESKGTSKGKDKKSAKDKGSKAGKGKTKGKTKGKGKKGKKS